MRTKLNPVPSLDAGERPIKRIVARHAFDRDGDVLAGHAGGGCYPGTPTISAVFWFRRQSAP